MEQSTEKLTKAAQLLRLGDYLYTTQLYQRKPRGLRPLYYNHLYVHRPTANLIIGLFQLGYLDTIYDTCQMGSVPIQIIRCCSIGIDGYR